MRNRVVLLVFGIATFLVLHAAPVLAVMRPGHT
jgi:hypothetical protein